MTYSKSILSSILLSPWNILRTLSRSQRAQYWSLFSETSNKQSFTISFTVRCISRNDRKEEQGLNSITVYLKNTVDILFPFPTTFKLTVVVSCKKLEPETQFQSDCVDGRTGRKYIQALQAEFHYLKLSCYFFSWPTKWFQFYFLFQQNIVLTSRLQKKIKKSNSGASSESGLHDEMKLAVKAYTVYIYLFKI